MSRIKLLRIRCQDESKHFLTIAERGFGNSQLIKQLLYYARESRDSCVALDSKLELMPELYSTDRGDKILSPLLH